jgi:hypothetical protein
MIPTNQQVIVYCRSIEVALKLQHLLGDRALTTYPSMPLSGDIQYDICVMTFEPMSELERSYYHGTIKRRLKKDAEHIWTIK